MHILLDKIDTLLNSHFNAWPMATKVWGWVKGPAGAMLLQGVAALVFVVVVLIFLILGFDCN